MAAPIATQCEQGKILTVGITPLKLRGPKAPKTHFLKRKGPFLRLNGAFPSKNNGPSHKI